MFKEVYLYQFSNGKLKANFGWIEGTGITVKFLSPETKTAKKVSSEEGEVRNGMIWLEKRCDPKAIVLFLRHETEEKKKLERKLNAVNEKLSYLTKIHTFCNVFDIKEEEE